MPRMHGCQLCACQRKLRYEALGAGYMVARMLGAAPVLADAIVEALCSASDKATDSHHAPGASTTEEAEELSAAVWHAIWPVERCWQLPYRAARPACCSEQSLVA